VGFFGAASPSRKLLGEPKIEFLGSTFSRLNSKLVFVWTPQFGWTPRLNYSVRHCDHCRTSWIPCMTCGIGTGYVAHDTNCTLLVAQTSCTPIRNCLTGATIYSKSRTTTYSFACNSAQCEAAFRVTVTFLTYVVKLWRRKVSQVQKLSRRL